MTHSQIDLIKLRFYTSAHLCPPHNPDVAGPSAARVASPQMPTPILRKKEKRQPTISDTSDSDTSSEKKAKEPLKDKRSLRRR